MIMHKRTTRGHPANDHPSWRAFFASRVGTERLAPPPTVFLLILSRRRRHDNGGRVGNARRAQSCTPYTFMTASPKTRRALSAGNRPVENRCVRRLGRQAMAGAVCRAKATMPAISSKYVQAQDRITPTILCSALVCNNWRLKAISGTDPATKDRLRPERCTVSRPQGHENRPLRGISIVTNVNRGRGETGGSGPPPVELRNSNSASAMPASSQC